MKPMFPKSLLVLLPLAVWAADNATPLDIKPGLWENTTKTEMGGRAMPAMPAIPPEALAQMPPEQRARVEAMMNSRKPGGGMTTKVCMTRDSLANGIRMAQQKGCTQKLVSSSSTKMVMHVECTEGANKSSGDVTFERIDSEHTKGNMAMKVSSGGAPPMDMKMVMEGKWLSSDCGDVKPVEAKQ
jgi:hypothetical protein